jgi:hypothetical protein
MTSKNTVSGQTLFKGYPLFFVMFSKTKRSWE